MFLNLSLVFTDDSNLPKVSELVDSHSPNTAAVVTRSTFGATLITKDMTTESLFSCVARSVAARIRQL